MDVYEFKASLVYTESPGSLMDYTGRLCLKKQNQKNHKIKNCSCGTLYIEAQVSWERKRVSDRDGTLCCFPIVLNTPTDYHGWFLLLFVYFVLIW